MSIQRLRCIIVVIGCLILLGVPNLGGAGKSEPVVTVGTGGDATTLDPAYQRDLRTGSIIGHIQEQLVCLDLDDLSAKPLLAKSWTMTDEKTYRFYLREGVRFHDGEPFNAEAVKYSLERFIAPETAAPRGFFLKMIDVIKVIDDHTVDVILKNPFAPFLQHLTMNGCGIVSPKAAKEWGLDKYAQHPAGTGPYKLKEWRKGEEIVLTRNEDYWGGLPKLKEIRFKVITEESTRVIALETGEIDIAENLPTYETDRLKKKPGINIMTRPSLRIVHVALNMEKKPFDDRRVRAAVYYATDTKGLVNALFGKYGIVPAGVMPPLIFGEKSLPKVYDPQKAKKLMAEAGYPNGFTTELWTCWGRYPQDKQAATLMAAQLEANIGIKAKIKVFEWGTYMGTLKTRKLPGMTLLGWGNNTGDADVSLYPQFHSSQRKGNKNLGNYSNPEVDELLDKARSVSDSDFRVKAYHKILDTLQEDHPWIPLYIPLQIFAVRDHVKGFVPSPVEAILLQNVYLAE